MLRYVFALGGALVIAFPVYSAVDVMDEKAQALFSSSLENIAKEWSCETFKKYSCNEKNGCNEIDGGLVSIRLDLNAEKYFRCDSKGCESSGAKIFSSGIYTYFDLGSGAVFKVLNDGSSFVDIATLMDTVLISYGVCLPK